MNTLWNEVIIKNLMERFSPMVLKILTDPRVQALFVEVLNLQSGLRENIEGQVKTVARTLDLATRDEVTGMRDVLKALETQVTELKAALDEKNRKIEEQGKALNNLTSEVEKTKATVQKAAETKPAKPKKAPKAAAPKKTAKKKTVTKKTATKTTGTAKKSTVKK